MSHRRSWSLSTLEPVANFTNLNTKQSMPTSTCVCSFFKLSMLRMWHVLAQVSKQRFFEFNHCISSVHKEQYFGHWSSSSVLLVIVFSKLFLFFLLQLVFWICCCCCCYSCFSFNKMSIRSVLFHTFIKQDFPSESHSERKKKHIIRLSYSVPSSDTETR